MTGRDLGHQLVPILDALRYPLALEGQAPARKQLHDIFARIPRDVMWRQDVLYTIGAKRQDTLDVEHTRWRRQRHRRATRGQQ